MTPPYALPRVLSGLVYVKDPDNPYSISGVGFPCPLPEVRTLLNAKP